MEKMSFSEERRAAWQIKCEEDVEGKIKDVMMLLWEVNKYGTEGGIPEEVEAKDGAVNISGSVELHRAF